MKWLLAFNTLLTLCVLALLLAGDDAPGVKGSRPVSPMPAETVAQGGTEASSMDEARLRLLIREELAALKDSAFRDEADQAQPQPREPDRYQREFVSQRIEHFKSVGHISSEEMQELQREIARLDQAGRREMLSRLTRAMNARQIEARF